MTSEKTAKLGYDFFSFMVGPPKQKLPNFFSKKQKKQDKSSQKTRVEAQEQDEAQEDIQEIIGNSQMASVMTRISPLDTSPNR